MTSLRAIGFCIALLLASVPACHASSRPALEELLVQADSVRSTDPGKFQQLLREIESRQAEASPVQQERLAYLNAYSSAITGNYDDAIAASEALLARSDNVDMQVRAGALLVNMYALTRRFADGLRHLERTVLLLDDVRDSEYREHALGVAALIYNQTGQYRLGARFARQVLDSTTSERARCYAGQSYMDALLHLQESPADNSQFSALITLCSDQGEHILANLVRSMLASKLAREGAPSQAIALLRRHMEEVRQTGYLPLASEFESLLAEFELEQGNLDAADGHAGAAISAGNGAEYTLPLVRAHRTRYLVAKERQDVPAELVHYRAFAEAEKGYLNEVQAREMAYQIVRHEMVQQSQEIELLNEKNTVLDLQKRVSEQRAQNRGLLVLLLGLLLATIAAWAYRTKRIQVRLRRMTQVDMLTGISNRHHFSESAHRVLAQCLRDGEPVALVMFDLDHFKQINDRYGHAAGDWALKQVAAVCSTLCRPVDSIGRLGGEEFAILLPGLGLRDGKRLAEDSRARLEAIDSSDSGFRLRISASFGVTDTSLSGFEFNRLLSHADRALYRAKRGGRNQVCEYRPEEVTRLSVVPGRDGTDKGQGPHALHS